MTAITLVSSKYGRVTLFVCARKYLAEKFPLQLFKDKIATALNKYTYTM